jgi:Flp pilus assembly pilin Flp
MKNVLMNIWQDESGAETAEWLVIVSLITAVGVLVYNGVLVTALTALVGQIQNAVTNIPAPTGP